MRIRTSVAFAAIISVMFCSSVCIAQARKTPVEVQNSPTVKIDGTNNAVKVDPTGNTVKIDSSINTVKIGNTANVSVTNTPSVQVTNTPTVAISGTSNVVKTPTQSCIVYSALANDVSLANFSGVLWSNVIDCSAYKELRFLICSNTTSQNLTVEVYFVAGNITKKVGQANFGSPTNSVTNQAGFTNTGGVCAFTIPVMGDHFYVNIGNATGGPVTIKKDGWVYMVN